MTATRQVFLALLLALSAVGGWPPPTRAAQLDPDVRDAVVPAAVQIAIVVTWKENSYARDYPMPLGSGTIVTSDGLILTNQHVVDRAEQRDLVAEWQRAIERDLPGVTLTLDESTFVVLGSDGVHPPKPRYRATLVREDEQIDLAVLRVSGDANGKPLDLARSPLPFVPVGDSNAVRLGDRVHLFAFPAIGGDALTYTEGVVSGFRYEDRADQPDWIMTDAVMSGGSSGGTAVDAAGRLIGVPTQGSKLDCRPGDTNGDGDVTPDDVGCIPTGGSIGELRPIDLAKPLLLAADPAFAIADETTKPSAATVEPAPDAPSTATSTPLPTVRPVPMPTASPAFGFVDDFDAVGIDDLANTETYAVTASPGTLTISIKAPGGLDGFTYGRLPTEGRDVGWRADIASTDGQGEVLLSLRAAQDGAEWWIAVDPAAQQWSMYRGASDDGSLFYWVTPRAYGDLAPGPLRSIEVRVRDGAPVVMVNDVDVTTPFAIEMPDIAGSQIVGFGAGINPGSLSGVGASFTVRFDRVRLYELP